MANAILSALSNQSNKYSLSKLVMVVAVISTLNGCGKHDQPNAAAGGGMVMPVIHQCADKHRGGSAN